MKQRQGRCWSIVAAMAAVATLAFGPIDASAVTLTYTQVGGFSFGSDERTSGGVGGVEYFAPTGYIVDNAASPNDGQATYGEIGWGCGSASASLGACSLPALDSAVAPRSPVTGLPAPPVADFPVNYRSALDVDVFSGTVDVGGDWVDISSLQHYNRTIGQNANTLTQIDIDTLLTLDTSPPGGGSDSDPGLVVIGFNETLNAGPCAPGTGNVPCPDIFTFEEAVFDPLIVTVGGVQYQVEFRLIFPITTIDERTGDPFANGATFCNDDVCTAENAISEAIIQMRIIALAVPAPASLLLLGFGLSGLGLAGWLRRS